MGLQDILNSFGSGSGNNVNTSANFTGANYNTGVEDILNSAGSLGANDFNFGNIGGASGGGEGGGGIMDFLGGDTFMGLAGNAMDLFGAISQYGMLGDQLDAQKDQLKFGKDAFNKNTANEAKLINNRQADQLASRLAYGTNEMDATQLGGDTQQGYLDKRKVDGSAIG